MTRGRIVTGRPEPRMDGGVREIRAPDRADARARRDGFCGASCREGYREDMRYGLIYPAGAGFMTWRETARAWGECAYCRADLMEVKR